jgi:hypothetical protein
MVNADKYLKEKMFRFNDRHVIYNHHESPQSSADLGLVRYHICVLDNKFIENQIIKIQSNFQNQSIVNFPFEDVRREGGIHKKTGFEYLFVSFDTQYTPKFLSFREVSNNVKKDPNLIERRFSDILDYVRRLYDDN